MGHGFQTMQYIDIIGDAIDPVNETPVLKGVHILEDKPAQSNKADGSSYPYKKFDQKK